MFLALYLPVTWLNCRYWDGEELWRSRLVLFDFTLSHTCITNARFYDLALTGVFILVSTTARSSDSLLGWNCAYSFTSNVMYGVLYAITPELFPTKDRGTGNALVAAANRIFGIMVSLAAHSHIWTITDRRSIGPDRCAQGRLDQLSSDFHRWSYFYRFGCYRSFTTLRVPWKGFSIISKMSFGLVCYSKLLERISFEYSARQTPIVTYCDSECYIHIVLTRELEVTASSKLSTEITPLEDLSHSRRGLMDGLIVAYLGFAIFSLQGWDLSAVHSTPMSCRKVSD